MTPEEYAFYHLNPALVKRVKARMAEDNHSTESVGFCTIEKKTVRHSYKDRENVLGLIMVITVRDINLKEIVTYPLNDLIPVPKRMSFVKRLVSWLHSKVCE